MKVKQIGLGAIISYLAILFNVIAGLLYTPWMIRTIGDSNYALYMLALSVISIFLLDFGIGTAVSKFISNFYANHEEIKIPGFLGTVYKLYSIISLLLLILFLIIYLFLDTIYVKLTINELHIFKILFIIVSLYSVLSFPFQPLNGILLAKEKFIQLKLCNLLQKISNVLLIIILLLIGGSVYSLVLVNALSNVVFIFIKWIIVHYSGIIASFKGSHFSITEIFNFSVWITIIQVSQKFIFSIAPSILAITIGSKEITIFSLAATIEGYVFMFGDAISGMFMPEVARNLASNQFVKKTDNLLINVGKFQLYIIGLLIVIFISIGNSFVKVWMGSGYDEIYLCAIFLIIPSLFDVPLEIGRTALLVSDKIKYVAYIYIIMTIVNISLSLPFSRVFGVYGTAFAICIAYGIRTIGVVIVLKNKLNLHMMNFYKKVYASWFFPALVTGVLGVFIEKVLPIISWKILIIKVILITIIYCSLLLFICINNEDRSKIFNKLRFFRKYFINK